MTDDKILQWENKSPSWSSAITIFDPNKFPTDIIVNGFSIKDTIFNFLKEYDKKMHWSQEELMEISEKIKEAFAIKMRLKQGTII